MSESSGEEETYVIEKILDRKKEKSNLVYLIKWEGYDSEENTWEKKSDLQMDGFHDVVNAYEKKYKREQAALKRKLKAEEAAAKKDKHEDKQNEDEEEEEEVKEKRSRSKTPARSIEKPTTNTPSTVDTSDTTKEEQKEEEEEEEEEVKQDEQTEEVSSTEVVDQPVLSYTPFMFVILFFFSAMTNVAVRAVRLALEKSVPKTTDATFFSLDLFSVVNNTFPMLLCIREIMTQAKMTDYSNRIAVCVLWVMVFTFSESLQAMGKSTLTSEDAQAVEFALLFSLGLWQFFTLFALYAPVSDEYNEEETEKKEQLGNEREPLTSVFSFLGYGVVSYFLYKLRMSSNPIPSVGRVEFSNIEFIVTWFALAATARAKARLFGALFSSVQVPLSLWLELSGAVLGTWFVIVQVFSSHEQLNRFLPKVESIPMRWNNENQNATIMLPLFEITQDIFVWSNIVAFTFSAVIFHG